MSYADENREWLVPYIDHLAESMGLKDWRFILDSDHPDGDDTGASISVTYGRRRATIRVTEPSSAEQLREWLVHELVHAHLDRIDTHMRTASTVLGSAAYELFSSSYFDHEEQVVDAIAVAWAKVLPLPDAA